MAPARIFIAANRTLTIKPNRANRAPVCEIEELGGTVDTAVCTLWSDASACDGIDEQKYKRSRLRKARKSSGSPARRIAALPEASHRRGHRENARRADQSGRPQSDRREIRGATRAASHARVRRRWSSCPSRSRW